MQFDPTISLGQVAEILAVLSGGVVVAFRLFVGWHTVRGEIAALKTERKENDARMEKRLDGMAAELTKQTDILVRMAGHEERLNSVEREVKDLRLTALERRIG